MIQQAILDQKNEIQQRKTAVLHSWSEEEKNDRQMVAFEQQQALYLILNKADKPADVLRNRLEACSQSTLLTVLPSNRSPQAVILECNHQDRVQFAQAELRFWVQSETSKSVEEFA